MKLSQLWTRLTTGKRPRDILPDYVEIGRGTYGLNRNSFAGLAPDAPVSIGAFCSFGPDVIVFCKADHPTHLVTTYPLRTLLLHPDAGNQDATTRGGVTVGNDVWVGARAMILSGVTVGNGAIIGAGAVVARDVPAYAVAVGNPARVVRHRLEPHQIAALERIAWWSWSDDKIRRFEAAFYGDVDRFIAAARDDE